MTKNWKINCNNCSGSQGKCYLGKMLFKSTTKIPTKQKIYIELATYGWWRRRDKIVSGTYPSTITEIVFKRDIGADSSWKSNPPHVITSNYDKRLY